MQIPSLREAFEKKGIDPKVGFAAAEVIKSHRRLVLNSISTHHIIPTSIHGSDQEENKQRLIHRKHEAIHTLFENQPTHQKIRQILEMDQTVLKPGFINAVDDTVERAESRGWIYKNGVFVRQ